jgi:4-carboxymuconolactone decarboxylase
MDEDRLARGARVRREVLGDAYVERVAGNASAFAAPFQELVGEYCWGWLWTRDELLRPTRSLLSIAILCVLNRPNELKAHVRGALRNGCSVAEIREALLHATVYGGVPCGSDSFRIVGQALEELDAENRSA